MLLNPNVAPNWRKITSKKSMSQEERNAYAKLPFSYAICIRTCSKAINFQIPQMVKLSVALREVTLSPLPLSKLPERWCFVPSLKTKNLTVGKSYVYVVFFWTGWPQWWNLTRVFYHCLTSGALYQSVLVPIFGLFHNMTQWSSSRLLWLSLW